MKKEEFIIELQEHLEFEGNLNGKSNLKENEDWSSLCAMIIIGYVSENFGVTLNANDIEDISTVETLIGKIGEERFS